uniref:Uncharacterized protein n=1 Tax=Megaselia scalaris TaxID=36166 RepID=T1GUL7_MEGSC
MGFPKSYFLLPSQIHKLPPLVLKSFLRDLVSKDSICISYPLGGGLTPPRGTIWKRNSLISAKLAGGGRHKLLGTHLSHGVLATVDAYYFIVYGDA